MTHTIGMNDYGTRYDLQASGERWRVMWQSPAMAAPAFAYFDSLEQATDYCALEPEAYRAKWFIGKEFDAWLRRKS